MIRRPPRSTLDRSSAASDVYKRQGKGSLTAEAQVAFYRLCQEGLNNIARHSKARNAQIQLQYGPEDGAVKLRIHDDGRGFEPEKIQSGHYGLTIMRERAAAVGLSPINI